MADEAYGLRLTLGGAPDTPHVVGDLPGFYRPGAPTPVGGEGQLSLEEAQKAADDPSIPLELVKLAKEEAEEAAAWVRHAFHEARAGTAELVRQGGPTGFETAQVQDQQAAIAATATEPAAPGQEG